jgi:hypothetical protein
VVTERRAARYGRMRINLHRSALERTNVAGDLGASLVR